MKGFKKDDVNKVHVVRDQGRNRAYGFKVYESSFSKGIGKKIYISRMVDEWKRISSHVV